MSLADSPNAHPQVTGATSLLAIVGDPIAQAGSPVLVNDKLAARGVDAVMVPLHVGSRELESIIRGFRAIRNFKGAIVTMPHKTAVLEFLDEISPAAAQIGACNVLRRTAADKLVGANFDGLGFVEGLKAAGYDLKGKRIYLAGAGGAASAIAFALASEGIASMRIYNRTESKARVVVDRVRALSTTLDVTLGSASPVGSDVVINATSLGMRVADALPFDCEHLSREMLAVEIIISPKETPFLTHALDRGCRVQFGDAMLSHQIDLMLAFMGLEKTSRTA